MYMNLKTLFSTVAIAVVLAGVPALYAYAQTPSAQGSGSMMQGGQGGMMQNGQGDMMGQGGMMNMMQQMSQMMETCNKMMQGMAQHHDREAPKDGTTPEKKG